MAFRKVNFGALVKSDSPYSQKILDNYDASFKEEFDNSRDIVSSKCMAPSSIRCMRRTWFRLRGVEKDSVKNPDIKLDFTAEMGTACHSMIQRRLSNYMKDDWIKIDDYLSEIHITHKYTLTENGYETMIEFFDVPIKFSVDGIVKLDDKYFLLEIKSSEHRSFSDLSMIKSEHLDQVDCYCTLLNLDCALVLYIDRVTGDMKCYTHAVSDIIKDSMNNYFKDVLQYVSSGIAPEGLPVGDKWCNPTMCDYYEKCKCYGR